MSDAHKKCLVTEFQQVTCSCIMLFVFDLLFRADQDGSRGVTMNAILEDGNVQVDDISLFPPTAEGFLFSFPKMRLRIDLRSAVAYCQGSRAQHTR